VERVGSGASWGSAGLRATCSLNQVHEIPRCFTICLALKHNIEVRGRSQRVQQRPKGEPLTTVLGQTEIDFYMLDAGVESLRWDGGYI